MWSNNNYQKLYSISRNSQFRAKVHLTVHLDSEHRLFIIDLSISEIQIQTKATFDFSTEIKDLMVGDDMSIYKYTIYKSAVTWLAGWVTGGGCFDSTEGSVSPLV